MRAGIFRRTVSNWSVAVASLLVFSSGVIHAYVDDLVVESDYYQLAPKDQQYDRTVLEEKGRIAETQGNVLAQISKLDDEIHKIDKDLSKYRSSEARNILLLERRRLFRKRREYKAVVASYTSGGVSVKAAFNSTDNIRNTATDTGTNAITAYLVLI